MVSKSFPKILLLLLMVLSSLALKVEEVPNPKTERDSFVQDSAGILGPTYLSLIDNIARSLEAGTSAELAVVTVDNLNNISVEEYAARLFKRYGVGKKEKDNGLLILFSLYDRKVRIEVGYGLEAIITDAIASRIIRNAGVPNFKQQKYAQGLFLMAKDLASRVAEAEGVPLAIGEPQSWPAQLKPQVVPPPEEPFSFKADKSYFSILIFIGVIFGGTGLLLAWKSLSFKRARPFALKKKVLSGFFVIPLFVWVLGFFGALLVGFMSSHLWIAFLGFFGSATGSSFWYGKFRKKLYGLLKDYRISCSDCSHDMNMVSEEDDDVFLTPEEIAEETAQGMDYEFWQCPNCELEERFEVKLSGAKPCSKCKRRTLVRSSKVLQNATTSSSGMRRCTEDCKNPKCDYHRTWTRTIPMISSSSSSSGGGFSSGGGSFGGGSSGGGGASGGW